MLREVGLSGGPEGVNDTESDVAPLPTALTARTCTRCRVPFVRPVMVTLVVLAPELAMFDQPLQLVPVLVRYCHLVMAEPPSPPFDHETVACALPAEALREVGFRGAVAVGCGTKGVKDTGLDAVPLPMALTARISTWCWVPFVRPANMKLVVLGPELVMSVQLLQLWKRDSWVADPVL